jgi:hypothetical protein
VRPLPPIEPLSPLCFPSLLPGVEVSHPKTINIKQYLNTNNFSSNLHKQHNCILQKYFINNSVVITFLLSVEASLSAEDNKVIKHSVKLIQSNIKLFLFKINIF